MDKEGPRTEVGNASLTGKSCLAKTENAGARVGGTELSHSVVEDRGEKHNKKNHGKASSYCGRTRAERDVLKQSYPVAEKPAWRHRSLICTVMSGKALVRPRKGVTRAWTRMKDLHFQERR